MAAIDRADLEKQYGPPVQYIPLQGGNSGPSVQRIPFNQGPAAASAPSDLRAQGENAPSGLLNQAASQAPAFVQATAPSNNGYLNALSPVHSAAAANGMVSTSLGMPLSSSDRHVDTGFDGPWNNYGFGHKRGGLYDIEKPPPGANMYWIEGYLKRKKLEMELDDQAIKHDDQSMKHEQLGMEHERVGMEHEKLGMEHERVGMEKTKLSMSQEQQSWARTDREQKKAISDGMITAANSGGYEGVIDYLKGVDPEKALEFHSMKTKLDQDLVKTDIMQSLAPVEKEKAMIEAYGAIGKFGHALLNADPHDRQGMYKNVLPIIKTINPGASNSLDENAISMFMLAAAQATPENILFKNQKVEEDAQSTIAKIGLDIQGLVKKGAQPGDGTVQGNTLQALMAQQNQFRDKAQQAQYNLLDMKLKMAAGATTAQQKVAQSTEAVNKSLLGASKDFNTFMSTYTPVAASIQSLKQNPNDAFAQISLSRSFAKALNGGGVMTDADAAAAFSAYGVADWKKRVQSWATGEKTNLNRNEQKALIHMYDAMAQKQLTRQLQIESQFQQSSSKYGGLVNWEAVRPPSAQYSALQAQAIGQAASAEGSKIAAAIAETITNPKLIPDFIQHFGFDPRKPQASPQQAESAPPVRRMQQAPQQAAAPGKQASPPPAVQQQLSQEQMQQMRQQQAGQSSTDSDGIQRSHSAEGDSAYIPF